MKSLFLLLTCLLTVPVFAQTTTRLTPYVRAGIGASRAVSESGSVSESVYLAGGVAPQPAVAADLGGNQWLLTGNVGLGLTIPVGTHFSVQVEANLEQKGSVMAVHRAIEGLISFCGCVVYPVDGRFTTRLTYLTLPVMASFRVGRLALSTGPYVGFKIDQQQEGYYSLVGTSGDRPIALSLQGGYRSTDAGLVMGLTYAILPSVAVDVRYNQSLRAVTDYYYEGYMDSPGVSTLRNQSAQLALRYNLLR